MRKSRRPSPALVIALIALFAALGGTVYAANQIKGSQIAKHSIPGNRLKSKSVSGSVMKPDTLTGKQIKEKSLKQVPEAAHAVNADNATDAKNADSATNAKNANNADHATQADNATTVNNHVAKCDTGTQLFAGACWQTAPNTASNWPAAGLTCASAGGTLPDTSSLHAFALQSGVTLDAGDEWAADINTITALNNYTVPTVAPNGDINLDNATADTKKFRCVIPLVH